MSVLSKYSPLSFIHVFCNDDDVLLIENFGRNVWFVVLVLGKITDPSNYLKWNF